MEIVIVHAEGKFDNNLDFLKTKLSANYHLIELHQYDKKIKQVQPDFCIYFHQSNGAISSGLEIIKKFKGEKNLPIITIIPKNDELFESAFHHGSDEVITYPYSQLEFLVRIKALLKKRYTLASEVKTPKNLQIQDLIINTDNYQVQRGKQLLPLTRLEFDILITLASNPDKVFQKKELYEMIWQDQYYDNGNVLNVHIRRLRKKIEIDPDQPKIIETRWGIGYKINL